MSLPSALPESFRRGVLLLFLACLAADPGEAGAPAPVRLAVPVFAIQYAPLYFGEKHGFYAAEGLRLEIQVLRTDLAMTALHSGKVDYIAHGGAALRGATRGFPVKLVLALDDRAAFWLLVRPEIRAPVMLRRKRIGVSFPGDTPYLVLRRYLRKHGLEPDKDVTYVSGQISPLGLQGLSAGALDAAVMAPPHSVLAERAGFHPLAHLGNEVPDAPTINGLVTSEAKIRSRPDEVGRVVRATLKSVRRYLSDPEAATAYLADAFGLERAVAERVYRDAAAVMLGDGEVSRKKIRDALALASELGGPPLGEGDADRLLDLSFLRAARR
ncbi:MAG TPA: ABC transporter substrate-binding protein [candidate division Zixibacteria bacterium]|nr:ABC transporter substrate-binding protein [candidate division Zixibacteria bacterium]